jgi:outer membrane protein assembly factor BamB
LTTAYVEPTDTRETRSAPDSLLKRVVVGLDLESGEILWQTPVFEGGKGKIHWLNTHATPTPATDGETVFVAFDAHLAALDLDGSVLWKKDLEPGYYAHSHYGVASSPIVTRKAVILLQDREEGNAEDRGWVVALDKKTGDLLWRDEWMDTCCSYTTPVLVDRGSKQILLVTTSHQANAYDPDTGARLWQVAHRNIQPVPSVAVWEDFVAFPGAIHDALLSTFRFGALDEEPEFLWATRQSVPDMPSPLYYNGRLYTLHGRGVMVSRNPLTGRAFWRRRLPRGTYRAALVAGDGKIYAFSANGTTAVIDATIREFNVLRRNRIGTGGSGATPAIAGGCLLLRGSNHLFCIEKKADPGDAKS